MDEKVKEWLSRQEAADDKEEKINQLKEAKRAIDKQIRELKDDSYVQGIAKLSESNPYAWGEQTLQLRLIQNGTERNWHSVCINNDPVKVVNYIDEAIRSLWKIRQKLDPDKEIDTWKEHN